MMVIISIIIAIITMMKKKKRGGTWGKRLISVFFFCNDLNHDFHQKLSPKIKENQS